jgi:hypothetical protein
MQVVSVATLASEMEGLIEQRAADVVCVSATPPAAVMHARYLCKRLRDRLHNKELVVGLWGTSGDLDRARERIGSGAIVVATLGQAQAQVNLLNQSRVPPAEKQTQVGADP